MTTEPIQERVSGLREWFHEFNAELDEDNPFEETSSFGFLISRAPKRFREAPEGGEH